MAHNDLDKLRERIQALDRTLLEQAALRIELSKELGEIKRGLKLPTIDYSQERLVLQRAREVAAEKGLDPDIAEDLLARLIRASVRVQDEERLRLAAAGAGKNAVVVGGAGRMGRWLTRFLSAQGYTAGALDPAADPDEDAWAHQALPEAELVVCAVPPARAAELYRSWCASPPRGVIADIASIKTPLLDPIRSLQEAGACVASIHPMFGPSTVLLRDADVVICDTGDAEATRAVEALFEPTTAHLVHLPIAEHDRIMGDLLSLAHATAIAFALALPETEHPVRSTTFQALERLASAVVRESPDVYYEIQAMNPHSAPAVERLRAGLDRIVAAVVQGDSERFRRLLEEGRRRTPGLK